MRIAIFGVGAVGGYFGGRLANAGHDVIFVARGETLSRLQTHGLEVNSVLGDFVIRHPQVVAHPIEAGPADLVLLAVKAQHVREAGRALAPLIGPETAVIPLQNGIEAPSLLAEILGRDHVLGGLCKIFSTRLAPARIQHGGFPPALIFGELGQAKTERVERIRSALEPASGMSVVTPDDIEAALWNKFLFVTPLGGVGAVARAPAGVLREVPETRRMLRAAMEEIVAIARKRNIALGDGAPDRAFELIDGLPAEATASMQRDVMAGEPSELEYQTGTVVRYGEESGVPTPVHCAIYAALLPSELRAAGKLAF
jgi:2-dehydropantoate 2-reductase